MEEAFKYTGFADQVEKLLSYYPRENVYAMYLLLGSHDTERLFSKLDGNLNKVKMAFAFLFAYPGTPAIYYGDELGFAGGKDPECRGAMTWDPIQWNQELYGWVKTLITLRRRMQVLRRGSYLRLYADDRQHIYAFARILGGESVLIVLNANPAPRNFRLNVEKLGWNEGRVVKNLLGIEEYGVNAKELLINIPGWSTIWIG